MTILLGGFNLIKNLIFLDFKSFINVNNNVYMHWLPLRHVVVISSLFDKSTAYIEKLVPSSISILSMTCFIITLYCLFNGFNSIWQSWRPFKLYLKWSHWLSYQHKQQHQLSNRNNRLILHFLQLQVSRLQQLNRCMCQAGIGQLIITYPFLIDTMYSFQLVQGDANNNYNKSFLFSSFLHLHTSMSSSIYPLLYIISSWFILHTLWSLVLVEVQALKGYSLAEDFITKNINDFLRKDKIPISITELDSIYTLESVFHILQSCQNRVLREQGLNLGSVSNSHRMNQANYLQYLAIPTFSTKVC